MLICAIETVPQGSTSKFLKHSNNSERFKVQSKPIKRDAMRDVFIFCSAFFFGTFYLLIIIMMLVRLRKIPGRVKLVMAILLLSGSGLAFIMWIAVTNPRNLDGKRVNAIAYSPVAKQCINVITIFDKEKVQIFTGDNPLKLSGGFEVQPNSFITMVLAERTLKDLEKIRVVETQHNGFVDLNVVSQKCPGKEN